MMRRARLGALVTIIMWLMVGSLLGQRQKEMLTRGVVVAKNGLDKVFISWRLLETDDENVAFNVYRNKVKVNAEPLTKSTCFEISWHKESSANLLAMLVIVLIEAR